uniref:Uncharacterized protein n=1 Tax=Romanomermis culicivorax TaxID=13658 RepID=A0A915IWD1_ROMCU
MEVPVSALVLYLFLLSNSKCDGQICTYFNAMKSLLAEFTEIPRTDYIERGEAIFNREQSKFNVSKDYGFFIDEPQSRLKTLIEGWTSKAFLAGSNAEMVWRAFNKTLSKKAKGSFLGKLADPDVGKWNSYRFVSARTAGDRLSVAYAFLMLKHKADRISITHTESDDLIHFVVYKNRKNFNEELAGDLARYTAEYDRCRS